jgi:hypothetical protein
MKKNSSESSKKLKACVKKECGKEAKQVAKITKNVPKHLAYNDPVRVKYIENTLKPSIKKAGECTVKKCTPKLNNVRRDMQQNSAPWWHLIGF